jgi:biopolymer transport protein ExbD
MITRPLDLASKLQREPKNFDVFFYVNAGLLVLFFFLFGSRFVIAPGLGVNFRIPTLSGADAGGTQTTSYISVQKDGQIFTDEGRLDIVQLKEWLKAEAKKYKKPVILVRADAGVTLSNLNEIYSAASDAGFAGILFAGQEATTAKTP